PPPFVEGRLGELSAICILADVGLDDDCLLAFLFRFFCSCLVFRVIHDEKPTPARQLHRRGGANSRRRTRDDRDFAHTVATGVAGEPTAPGRRSGGAVRRKRLRLCSRSHLASGVKYQSSPRWMPFLKRQCWCSGSMAWVSVFQGVVEKSSTA